jgi:integrase
MIDSACESTTLDYAMSVCTYTRKDSPYFWLQWGADNYRVNRSSGVRLDDPDADLKLAKRINKIEAQQLLRNSGAGWDWVTVFFSAVYKNSPDTLRIHLNSWNWLRAYLRERGIAAPDVLTRQHVFDYLDWRTAQRKEKSKRHPRRNTALFEMRVLGRVMDEAVLREMAERNPAAKLGLRRDAAQPKPEILPEQQDTIFAALRKRPLWMQRSFRIALQTGLRRDETVIDLRRNIDWENARITVPDPKGGPTRAFTFPIVQMSILPYLRNIRDQFTWDRSGAASAGKPIGVIWREFFDEIDMPEICFHCTRVTFITWCHRQSIPENVIMKLVNHASTEIHRIYQRLNVVDLQAWRDRVADPYVARVAR